MVNSFLVEVLNKTLVTKPPHGNSTAISFQEIVAIQLKNCPDRFIGPFFTNKIGHWRRKTKAAKSLLFSLNFFGILLLLDSVIPRSSVSDILT